MFLLLYIQWEKKWAVIVLLQLKHFYWLHNYSFKVILFISIYYKCGNSEKTLTFGKLILFW